MKSPDLDPTPVKVINAAVLSCLDDMFYRLPFPNQIELEKLIKVSQGEAQMSDFRAEIREDLNLPRALKDFESGWDKYWKETQSQKRVAAARGKPTKSMKDRIRHGAETPETPVTPEENSSDGNSGDVGEGQSLSQQVP